MVQIDEGFSAILAQFRCQEFLLHEERVRHVISKQPQGLQPLIERFVR